MRTPLDVGHHPLGFFQKDVFNARLVQMEYTAIEDDGRRSAPTPTADDPERSDTLLSVRLEHDTLVVYGADRRYGPLVPMSATRFHLQATPLDIEFVVEAGRARSLTLLTSDGKRHGYRALTVAGRQGESGL